MDRYFADDLEESQGRLTDQILLVQIGSGKLVAKLFVRILENP
jgi:hypothetical protein